MANVSVAVEIETRTEHDLSTVLQGVADDQSVSVGTLVGRSDSPASLRQSGCRDFDAPPFTVYIAAMCGRFTQHYTWKEIHDLYELTAAKPPTNMRPRYNVCPTTIVDTVR